MKDKISRNLASIIGRYIKKNILVIESDDWGCIRRTSSKSYQNLIKGGIPVDKCPYNTYDSLETVEDIEVLNDFCKGFRDSKGNLLKITANFIMANPNFESIKDSGLLSYHYRDLLDTYQYYQGGDQTFQAIRNAVNQKVIVPQLHAREHLQVNYWLNALKNGDRETRLAFDNDVWGHPSSYGKLNGINFSSAYHIRSIEELEFIKNSVVEASQLFSNSFGMISETIIPPRFIWPKELEPTFYQTGIKAIQGKLIQLIPKMVSDNTVLLQKIHWMGKTNPSGLQYLIRNVFFEPTQKPQFSWESDAMSRIETAFYWGKPAVISMHRLNFMGGFSNQNRMNSLNRLSKLILAVQSKYPEVEFLSSNELYRLAYEN